MMDMPQSELQDEDSQESSASHTSVNVTTRKAFRIRQSTMKKLRSKSSSFLDVQNSPVWLRLDAIHEEHVRKVLVGSHWILSDESNQVFGMLILLQSVAFGIELGFEAQQSDEGLLERLGTALYVLAVLELLFLILFSVEFCLRSQALGQVGQLGNS